MKAAVLYEIETHLKIEEFDLPRPSANQVRVRLIASGVCHSDWHIVKGDWPPSQATCYSRTRRGWNRRRNRKRCDPSAGR